MTRDEAVRSFTTWNAYAARQEREPGSLEPGRCADLVVLSDDVFTCAKERIKAVTPVLTSHVGEPVVRLAAALTTIAAPHRAGRRRGGDLPATLIGRSEQRREAGR